jgi:hypothetical protein
LTIGESSDTSRSDDERKLLTVKRIEEGES